MSGRELVVLGTASQAPTRHRNHNGYLLRWDGFGILFDPGEGTQRQMVLAGVPSSAVDIICITHLHGDHCLGLPGVLARMSLDRRDGPVHIFFPAASAGEVQHLLEVAPGRRTIVPVPVACGDGDVAEAAGLRISARTLAHNVPTVGWRIEGPAGRTMDRAALDAAGIIGSAVGDLIREGRVTNDRGTFYLDDLSRPRHGHSFAFVMDTRPCQGATELAGGVDMLVCESTFLSGEEALAAEYGHMTARQAGELAREAGARRLVLTHFSQRHPDEQDFAAEASEVFTDVVAARDLDVIPFPARQPPRPEGGR